MGCHSLLQGIFPTQGLNQGLLHCRQVLYHLSHQGNPYMCMYKYVQTYIWERERERDIPFLSTLTFLIPTNSIVNFIKSTEYATLIYFKLTLFLQFLFKVVLSSLYCYMNVGIIIQCQPNCNESNELIGHSTFK